MWNNRKVFRVIPVFPLNKLLLDFVDIADNVNNL
jgi:hypothetical protein